MGKLDEKAALNVEIGLVGSRPLGHEAEPKPVGGGNRCLEPDVEEARFIILEVDDVPRLGIEREPAPADLDLRAGRHSGGAPEDDTEYRDRRQGDVLADLE